MNITSSLGGEAQQLLVMPPPKYTDQLLELGLGASTRARIRASTRASTRVAVVVCAGGLTFFLHEQHRLKQAVWEGRHKNSLLQLLELGLGASTRANTKARTGLALGLGLGLGLTVGLEIVLVRIISVDSLGSS